VERRWELGLCVLVAITIARCSLRVFSRLPAALLSGRAQRVVVSVSVRQEKRDRDPSQTHRHTHAVTALFFFSSCCFYLPSSPVTAIVISEEKKIN